MRVRLAAVQSVCAAVAAVPADHVKCSVPPARRSPTHMSATRLITLPLTDGAVTLRAWTVEDAAAMRRIFRDPAMYQWTDADPSEGVDVFEGWIRRARQRIADGERWSLAITAAGDDEILGAIDLLRGELGRGEIGYALGSWARGQGYATRAVRLLSAAAFDATELVRLELPIPVGNLRSRAVAQRAGYQYEGLLRSYLTLRDGGERHDVTMFSLLPGDTVSG